MQDELCRLVENSQDKAKASEKPDGVVTYVEGDKSTL